jgi:hypothetical protein
MQQPLQVKPAATQHLINTISPPQQKITNVTVAQPPRLANLPSNTHTFGRTGLTGDVYHPALADQIKHDLQKKLAVPAAAAQQVKETAQQFITRPAIEGIDSLRFKQHTYHPDSYIEKQIFGDTPVQNVEKNVKNNYDTHSNLSQPARIGLAVADALGQGAMILPVTGGAAKAANKVVPDALHTVTPGLLKALDGLKNVHADEGGFLGFKGPASRHPAIKAYDQHLNDLNKARDQLVANGADKRTIQANARAYKETLKAKNDTLKQISQGGYAKVPGASNTPSELPSLPDNKFSLPGELPKRPNLKTNSKVSSNSSIDPLAALKQEALKYKSADEFANSKVNAYHGSTNDKLTSLTPGSKTGLNEKRNLIYLSPDESAASAYAKTRGAGGLGELSDSPTGTVYPAHVSGQILDAYDRNALNKLTQSPYFNNLSGKTRNMLTNDTGLSAAQLEANPELVNFLKSNGIGGVSSHLPNGGGAREIIALDPKNVATKQQLTDIYNQAHAEAKIPVKRSQLSGKALSTPNKDLASPEEIGKALGLSDKQMATASRELSPKRPAKIAETPRTQPEPRGLPVSSTNQPRSVGKSLTKDIPQFHEDIKGKNLNVKAKVGLHDYLRTPEKVLQKIGLGNEAKALRKADHAYKSELPKEIDRIKSWMARTPEQGASERIFKWLDGQKGAKLQGEELKVAKEMKAYLSQWADRLGLPKDKRVTNYITHIFEDKLIMKEFDPELEKLIADKVPGSVYDPFTQQRLGAQGYKEDAYLALQAYVKRGVRKANFDPALEQLTNAAQGLDLHSWNYVKAYGDRINMRPTTLDSLIDTSIKQTPIGYRLGQRPFARISQGIRQATYRSALGLNIGSAVRNLTQGVNTFAELGSRWTGVGYTKALKAIAERDSELQNVGVLDNSFVEDQTISAFKQGLQKLDKGLFTFFEAAERVNRGAAYYGAKAKALNEGKSLEEAVQEGIDVARKTQFTFGKVDTPVALQSDLAKLLTQFQTYNVKQIEFLAELAKNKEYAKLLRFTGASAVVFLTVGKALGYRPKDMLPTPQIGQTPAMKVAGDIPNVITKHDAKSLSKLGKDAGSAFVPGFVQAKKTVTGINAVNKGEVQKGNKKYAVEKTPRNYVKGAVFGPYSLNGQPKKEAKQQAEPGGSNKTTGGYTKREAKALNPDRQQAWNDMTAKARSNVATNNPQKYVQRETARVQQQLAAGKITPATALKETHKIKKVQILSTYGRDVTDAYNLNSTEFKAYYASASPDKQAKLRELDKKLLDAGLISRSKFPKVKVAKAKKMKISKGSSSKGRSSSKTATVKPPTIRIKKLSLKAPPKLKTSKPKSIKVAKLRSSTPKKIKFTA